MRHPTPRWGAGALRALLVLAALVAFDRMQEAQAQSVQNRQSSAIALTEDGAWLVNVNPDANTISLFDVISSDTPTKLAEIPVGREPNSVAIYPGLNLAYVANTLDGTVSVVDLNAFAVINTISVGVEPMAVATAPNGTRLYVACASSNTLVVINTASDKIVASVDLSPFGTSPRALAITNNGDTNDLDEIIMIPMFFGERRAGKTQVHEGQDDQKEGRVAIIFAGTNEPLPGSPVALGPMTNVGFNANGRLAGGPGGETVVPPTNPQTFTTPTGAFPNQLAAISIQPFTANTYVVSTGASPNGPVRFNVNNQGLVSVFDNFFGTEITAGQSDEEFRRTAPLNMNQGVNLATVPEPRLFLSNPVAMAWRPDGSDAWVVIQNTDLVVRLWTDGTGIPSVGAPLAAGVGQITRVDLQAPGAGRIAGKAPRGIAINNGGTRAYVANFVSRSVTVIDISNAAAPTIVGTARSTRIPAPGTQDALLLQGAELFYTGRGPEGRMSSEGWGGCITCHPNGRADNITWMFAAGPRQTVPLDGMFNKRNPADQRLLNWSAIFDENHDFELNTRGVFGGRGLIDNDRLFLAIGGATGATPTDSNLIQQFHQVTGLATNTNALFGNRILPTLSSFSPRRNFAIATLSTDRVYIIGGRSGSGAGALVSATDAVLEFNPRTNQLRRRSSAGFTLRHTLGAAVVRTAGGPRIYAMGGYPSTSPTATPVTTVQEYNPGTDSWRTVASLPTAVAQFGITVTGGTNTAEPRQLIHVVSGNAGSESTPTLANVAGNALVQRFQPDLAPSDGTWSTFGPAGLTPRRNHGAATAFRGVTSRVFVIGGQNAAGTVLNTVEEYLGQAVTTVTSVHTALPAPRASFGISSSLSTNQIYVIGGVDGAGADQNTVLEYTIANQGASPGPLGTPSGTWATRTTTLTARRDLQVSTPAGITNFLPARSAGRDRRQDALAAWVANKVRSSRAPVDALDPAAVRGRELFGEVGLVTPGVSCATCHGGGKWTRSRVDFPSPPSPDDNLGLGAERIIGAEMRKTASQASVLQNVGTFTPNSPGGRQNETRFNPADIAQQVAPLGANGFNIPSLLSVHETAPYFYSGLAQTLEEVLDGTHDGNGGVRHHLVADPKKQQDLIMFLRSIDETTPIFP